MQDSDLRLRLESSVAVIGLAGRFPGAAGVRAFWESLRGGVESITFFTDEELREAGVEAVQDYFRSVWGVAAARFRLVAENLDVDEDRTRG